MLVDVLIECLCLFVAIGLFASVYRVWTWLEKWSLRRRYFGNRMNDEQLAEMQQERERRNQEREDK
jgi:hypothetical protein